MDTSTQGWVASLKNAYPQLPDSLSSELEFDCIARLSRWFEHVVELRDLYDTLPRNELPEWLQAEAGKRQIIPVLWSLEEGMTDDEVDAWHTLFVCLSAQLADIGTTYWRTQHSKSSAMALVDVLNYLPVVFLYVLSSYNPYPSVESHTENFSHSKDGRVRLITWVSIDARRHISSYLQQHVHTVRQGSGYVQRLRQAVHSIQRAHLTAEGHMPSEEMLIEEIRKTHYGTIVTEATLRNHVTDLLQTHPTVSINDTFGTDSDREVRLEHTLSADYTDIDDYFDPGKDIETDVGGNLTLLAACQKLLDIESSEPLSFPERFILGS